MQKKNHNGPKIGLISLKYNLTYIVLAICQGKLKLYRHHIKKKTQK